jgi:hypothetical protein
VRTINSRVQLISDLHNGKFCVLERTEIRSDSRSASYSSDGVMCVTDCMASNFPIYQVMVKQPKLPPGSVVDDMWVRM